MRPKVDPELATTCLLNRSRGSHSTWSSPRLWISFQDRSGIGRFGPFSGVAVAGEGCTGGRIQRRSDPADCGYRCASTQPDNGDRSSQRSASPARSVAEGLLSHGDQHQELKWNSVGCSDKQPSLPIGPGRKLEIIFANWTSTGNRSDSPSGDAGDR